MADQETLGVRIHQLFAILSVFASLAHAQPSKPKAALVLPPVASGARAVITTDAIGAALVAGTWAPPKAGDAVTLADGSKKAWEAAEFADNGTLSNPALRGGYAFVPVTCENPGVWILEATGHGAVFVNGEPRTGDPYQNGTVHLPVALRAGQNDLLFRVGRGELHLEFAPVQAPLMIETVDPTLPDVVEGGGGPMLGAAVVINATTQWVRGAALVAAMEGGPETTEAIEPMPPLSMRKVGFAFEAATKPGQTELKLSVRVVPPEALKSPEPPKPAAFPIRIRKPADTRKITFRSGIDNSVQYYTLKAAVPPDGKQEQLGFILSLHGASVEATNQADAYANKPWANIVCPTNRRAFGFDWEDWGRLDALEVFDLATAALKPDPQRVYLTGHSMGGHGTWQLGAHFADRFAGIAPSAGWSDMWSYSGMAEYKGGTPIEGILRRASAGSDTLALIRNVGSLGVYILHGDADDNVPVDQARKMRGKLAEFHPDFAYYERPGAGHWWGNECMDWPPLMEFFKARSRPETRDIRRVEFATANPGISGTRAWMTIEAQVRPMVTSSVSLAFAPATRTISGTTQNVARVTFDLSPLTVPRHFERDGKPVDEVALEPGKPMTIELDHQKLADIPWPSAQPRITLYREGDQWRIGGWAPATLKGPNRSGPFKDAFRNAMVFVVGTGGTDEERATTLARARYDAETFWYRGNGSIPIVLDSEFEVAKDPGRNVILYGNADTNAAWKLLLADSPIQVKAGSLKVGDKQIDGVDLACLFIRPRAGNDKACVGAIASTGPVGMRLTQRVPYFVSGVGVPDWIVIGADAMEKGLAGVRGAGFFANDWGLSAEDSAWPVEPAPAAAPVNPPAPATPVPASPK